MQTTQMTVYQAWKAGALDWAIDRGIIRTAVITYCNLFDTYTRLRETEGLSYTQAVQKTSELMNTSPETVKRAVAEMGATP